MKRCLVIALGAGVAIAANPPTAPTHYDHAVHAARGLTKCETCHAIDTKGVISPPAAIGHSPCLDAKCHATYFVGVGAQGKAKDPALYQRATAFCLGCHDSPDGSPPVPSKHQTTNAVAASYAGEREYHVVMTAKPNEPGHFAHTQRGECRDCHTVGGKTSSTPGHAQCIRCHNGDDPVLQMSSCDRCHKTPGRAAFYKDSRAGVDVRACGSEGHVALAARLKLPVDQVACFTHENPKHRLRIVKGVETAVQCVDCHFLVTKNMYDLSDLHGKAIIPQSQSEHAACGEAGCHANDFDRSRGGGKVCLKCHGDHARAMFQ